MVCSPGDQRIDRELGGVSEAYFRPAFRKIPSDIEVPEGHMARFDCIVVGRPNPDVYWFRDGTQVERSTMKFTTSFIFEKKIKAAFEIFSEINNYITCVSYK